MTKTARKTRTKKDKHIEMLSDVLENNSQAVLKGPKKKTWTLHDLTTISPKTFAQKQMFEGFVMGNHIVASGCPGTGKSLCALYLALATILDPRQPQKKIILVRSPTATKNQGFLPGSLADKQEPFEAPFKDILHDLLGSKNSYDDMKAAGLLEFHTTSYIRGSNWHDAVVIIEECQSATFHELNSIITRLAGNSRIIICGDLGQNDLIYNKFEVSGMKDMLRVVERMDEFDIITFTKEDILRSEFVKSCICAKEDLGL